VEPRRIENATLILYGAMAKQGQRFLVSAGRHAIGPGVKGLA